MTLTVEQLIEELQKCNPKSHVMFDDDQRYFYPILDLWDEYTDCNKCYEEVKFNDCSPCAELNANTIKDYSQYCNKYTLNNVVILKSDYQQSRDTVSGILE